MVEPVAPVLGVTTTFPLLVVEVYAVIVDWKPGASVIGEFPGIPIIDRPVKLVSTLVIVIE